VTPVSAKAVTIGIDIGTTAVKAVAADEDGHVVARTRIPHQLLVPAPDLFEHDADEAWRRGPLAALAELGRPDAVAVAVTAMVPSLTAVDDEGGPLTPGLLYGDSRGRGGAGADTTFLSGETVEFLRWTAREAPDAKGYWPATAVANHALAGEAVIDNATASTTYPLFDGTGWSEDMCAECGTTAERMPRVEPTGAAVGQLRDADAVLAAGWTLHAGDGPPRAVRVDRGWEVQGWPRFSGIGGYRVRFDLPAADLAWPDWELVLDGVHTAADLELNGTQIGRFGWAPIECPVPKGLLRAEGNELCVAVASTAANRYYAGTGQQGPALDPSGLTTPPVLRPRPADSSTVELR